MSIYPSPENVLQAFAELVGNDDEEAETPQADIDAEIKKIPAISSPAGVISRFITLVEVTRESLVPCLIATPYVYLSESDWTLSNHAEFRAKKRDQLSEILTLLKSNGVEVEGEKLRSLIDNFEGILKDIFKVRIPLMPNLYVTENFYETVGASEIAEDLAKAMAELRIFDSKTRLQGLTKVLMKWFMLCPVGRPQIYVSDTEWTTSNERDLRTEYRTRLINGV